MVWGTCIIDEQVQSWLRFEKVLSKSSHRFEAAEIKLHEQDVIASCGLNNKRRFNKHSKLLNQWSDVMVLTFLMSFIAATAFFWFLQARMTLTPRPVRSRAVAFPIPVFPPETPNQTSLKTKTKTRAGFPQCSRTCHILKRTQTWRRHARFNTTFLSDVICSYLNKNVYQNTSPVIMAVFPVISAVPLHFDFLNNVSTKTT